MKPKEDFLKTLNDLHLEVDTLLVDELALRFNIYSKDIEDRLLECARNLGNPAYEHSSLTHEAIDKLREETLDYLGVPK